MILFLGAGASSQFGIPTTKDFAIKAIESLSSEPAYKKYDTFLHEIKDTFKDDFDLEILLTVLDDLSKDDALKIISPVTVRFILEKKNPKKYIEKSEIKEVSKELFIGVADYMRFTISEKIKEKKADMIAIYSKFFDTMSAFAGSNVAKDGGVAIPGMEAIITTNYDMCIEIVLNERRLLFEDNIIRSSGKNYLELQRVDQPNYSPHLIKLHGSLDLFRLKDGRIVQLQYPYQKYNELKETARTYGLDIEDEIILYPTESGADKRVIETPFTDLYFRFRKTFESYPKLVIVGFSMRDNTICSILEYTLANKKLNNPKIVLIDPNANEIRKSLLGKGFRKLYVAIVPVDARIDDSKLADKMRKNSVNLR